jgi:subtilisin family serine protease
MEEIERLGHIEINREPDWEPERRRRSLGGGAPEPPRPEDREQHGDEVEEDVQSTADQIQKSRSDSGVIPERLIVMEFESSGVMGSDIHEAFERMDSNVVDEEDWKDEEDNLHHRYLVQFPDEETLQAFREEIESYREEREETTDLSYSLRRDFFDGLKDVRSLTAADRTGPRLEEALEQGDLPQAPFYVDIDLWRPEDQGDARDLIQEIRQLCREGDGGVTDQVLTNSLLLLRAEVNREVLDTLLGLDVVALVDFPPRADASVAAIFDRGNIPDDLPDPDPNAPRICVIDSGVVPGHPCLQGWVVNGRDYNTGENTPADQNGHGTKVAGFAAYGEIRDRMVSGDWSPKALISNAKVLRHGGHGSPVFPEESRIEGVIADAIRDFAEEGCKIFNLSIGDRDRVYSGGRQFQWAEKLDEVARDLDVVIVVSAGNRPEPPIPDGRTSNELRSSLKENLLDETQRVCCPATAALPVTVGAISRQNAVVSEDGSRNIPDAIPASPKFGTSPFSRTGPGYSLHSSKKPAIKPEFVHFGGNYALQTIAGGPPRWVKSHYLIGEPCITTENNGRFLGTDAGTSFATPRVAHAAALAAKSVENLTGEPPSANLIRALLGSASASPPCEDDWLEEEEEQLSLVGYGVCRDDEVQYSSSNRVHVVASDEIELDRLHVYRIPIPDSFLREKGRRGIVASLAYDPPVRSSRKEYLSRTMRFDVFHGLTNSKVAKYRAQQDGEEPSLPTRNQLNLRPPKTRVQWSTLQVRRKSWQQRPVIRANSEDGSPILHLMVLCQSRFEMKLQPPVQSYSISVKFWHENSEVDMHEKIRNEARLTQRARARETVRVQS